MNESNPRLHTSTAVCAAAHSSTVSTPPALPFLRSCLPKPLSAYNPHVFHPRATIPDQHRHRYRAKQSCAVLCCAMLCARAQILSSAVLGRLPTPNPTARAHTRCRSTLSVLYCHALRQCAAQTRSFQTANFNIYLRNTVSRCVAALHCAADYLCTAWSLPDLCCSSAAPLPPLHDRGDRGRCPEPTPGVGGLRGEKIAPTGAGHPSATSRHFMQRYVLSCHTSPPLPPYQAGPGLLPPQASGPRTQAPGARNPEPRRGACLASQEHSRRPWLHLRPPPSLDPYSPDPPPHPPQLKP
jgi:hypothetical protein